jgi:hypothetical protein
LLAFAASAPAQSTMAPLLTRAWDNHRSGWNQQEAVLTQANVKARGITRITTIPVIGDARGIESQPLILPGVTLTDGTTHDVMILPSMANVVRGVDATTGAALWQTPPLGTPITGSDSLGPNGPGAMCPGPNQTIDCYQINDKWGVLSTGVVDPDTSLVYLVAWISPDGTPQNGKHYMYVLNVKDGTQAIAPVLIAGSNGSQAWSAYMRKQRSSLVMTNINDRKTIFFASGTIQELGTGAEGWVIAYDVATNQVTAALPTTQGFGGGIWMGSLETAPLTVSTISLNRFSRSSTRRPPARRPLLSKSSAGSLPIAMRRARPAATPARRQRRPPNLRASVRRLKPSVP